MQAIFFSSSGAGDLNARMYVRRIDVTFSLLVKYRVINCNAIKEKKITHSQIVWISATREILTKNAPVRSRWLRQCDQIWHFFESTAVSTVPKSGRIDSVHASV